MRVIVKMRGLLPFRPTWLGFLNYCLLQWFWLRLARVTDPATPDVTLRWTVLFPVRPLDLYR